MRSSVCSRSCGSTRAGWPRRTALFAVGQQAFEQVVHRQVARRTRQHLVAAAHRLANQLDDRGRLAGAGRAVDDGQVAGRQGQPHRLALRVVQRRIEGRLLGSFVKRRCHVPQEDGPQFGETIAFGLPGLLQGGALPQPRRLVTGQIQPIKRLLAVVLDGIVEGHGDGGLRPLANHAAPAGVLFASLGRQQHGCARLQARPREFLAAIAFAQGQQKAAAKAAELFVNREPHQAVPRLLGLLRGQAFSLLQDRAGLGVGLHFEERCQALEVIVKRDGFPRPADRTRNRPWRKAAPSRARTRRASHESGTSMVASRPAMSMRPTCLPSMPPCSQTKPEQVTPGDAGRQRFEVESAIRWHHIKDQQGQGRTGTQSLISE